MALIVQPDRAVWHGFLEFEQANAVLMPAAFPLRRVGDYHPPDSVGD
jgi:hypothetical protein